MITPTITNFAGQELGRATFENLDLLLLLEMRPHGLTQGVVPLLYKQCRPSNSQPLSKLAADEILARPGSRVAIYTGMYIPGHMPHGETDGPLGAVVLARALRKLNYNPVVVTEAEVLPVVRGVAEVIGESELEIIDAYTFENSEQVTEFAKTVDIGIAIEKLGYNAQGIRHTVGGNSVTTGDQWAEHAIDAIRRSGGYTIGIGDNGNEIGFGAISTMIKPIVPRGTMCRCDCGGGIVTSQETDITLPCAVSNYGGYIIAAALACLSGDQSLTVSGEEVDAMLRRALALGAVNGGLEEDGFVGDDGVPVHAASAYAVLCDTVMRQFFVRVGDHN